MQNKIDIKFYRLLLGGINDIEKIKKSDRDHAVQKAKEVVGFEKQIEKKNVYEFRLRLAIHLCPREAINYDKTNPLPRHEIIKHYLIKEFEYEEDTVERLSRDLQNLIDSWETSRSNVVRHRDDLLKKQNNKCANCNISFDDTVFEGDKYRTVGVDDPIPHVDHIEPVSSFGTNNQDNLQILCEFCNQGKKRGLGIDPKKEFKHAGKTEDNIPKNHIRRLYYYIIHTHDSKCSVCGEDDQFLTIEKIRDTGGLIRSNMRPVCDNCRC